MERIDIELGRFLGKWPGKLRLCITADHTTWSKEEVHTDDPVPVLLHGRSIRSDSFKEFNEIQALKGQLDVLECINCGKSFLPDDSQACFIST